jgi:hypothetical protein
MTLKIGGGYIWKNGKPQKDREIKSFAVGDLWNMTVQCICRYMYMIGYLTSKLLVYKRFLGDSGLDGWFGEVYECFFLAKYIWRATVDLFC